MPGHRIGREHDCPHDGRHDHGTLSAYNADKCRCLLCADAKSRHDTNIRKLKAYGRWEPYFVPAGPVRCHVADLMRHGMGYERIARVAGVSVSAVGGLLYGKPVRRTVHRRTALAILATGLDLSSTAGRDATGTRRRIQALTAAGWSDMELGRRLGVSGSRVGQMRGWPLVSSVTIGRIQRLYDELWDQAPPARTADERRAVTRAKRRAASNGFVPPLAWDDETINDPAAKPHRSRKTLAVVGFDEVMARRVMGGTLRLPRNTQAPERIEAIRRLAGLRLSDVQIAERVGCTAHAVLKMRERHGIPAGRPRPGWNGEAA